MKDTYTDVRKAFATAPSAWVDFKHEVINAPNNFRVFISRIAGHFRTLQLFFRAPVSAISGAAGRTAGHFELSDEGLSRSSGTSLTLRAEPMGVVAVINALTESPLALQTSVTFDDIASALAVPREQVEAICSSWHILTVLESGLRGGGSIFPVRR